MKWPCPLLTVQVTFWVGAILFSVPLVKSTVVPRWLPIWWRIATFTMLVGNVTQILGYAIPVVVCLP